MVKRLLDCSSSDFKNMAKKEIIESIAASEGRVLVSEVIGSLQSALINISNAELACAFGADILLLNMFDVDNPIFNGVQTVKKDEIIHEIKRLTGRIIGINLEPIDEEQETIGEISKLSEGRKATIENARKACELGCNILLLTGNPGTGVSNKRIVNTLKGIHADLGSKLVLMAGKMHASGSLKESGENIITKSDINEFVNAGADVILLPAPGTVPGITMEYVKQLVDYCHELGVLTITSIGTSQEGSDSGTIRNIALMCKMTGTDMHHIGDSGYAGIAIPENIMDYSIAIRGKRHTYSRIARSINR